MKAAQIKEYGSADNVEVVEVDKPATAAGQVLVEVYAASLNPFDTMVREGYVAAMIPSLPITLGGDIAGVVAAVGEGVEGLSVGDEVYGSANVVAGASGAFAEFAVTSAEQLGKKPTKHSFEEAAATVLVGVSALQALDQHINLQPGQKILIHGGAGSIGSIAIQVAKHTGAYVATTVKTDDIDYVKSLGADEVIDYKTQDFTKIVQDFDAVFVTAGDALDASIAILKPGGIAVSMVGGLDKPAADTKQVTIIAQMTQVTTELLSKLSDLIEKGVVKARIGKVFPLADVQAAFKARESGSTGKVVLTTK